jgi:HEAT repeat protein
MKGFLPFLIELRSYVSLCEKNKCNNFLEFLKATGEAENWELNNLELRRYLRDDGRAVIIFDGLDEIFDTEAREQIKRQIVGFTCAYPKVRVIVTSRITGYWPGILMDAGFVHFTLQDLEEKQVATFVESWYSLALKDRPMEAEGCCARIMHLFKEFSPIRQLAANPMLLTMMAIIGRHQELPRERKDLYYHTTNVLIHLWDVNKHLEDRHVHVGLIDKEDKKELLRRLAYKMQQDVRSRKAVNYVHREELQAQFKNYLEERYKETPGQAVRVAREMIDQFRERNFILALYGVDLYGFVHRAFLDYFCARAIVRKFEKSRDIKPDELTRKIYGAHWKDPRWHEVLSLICGMVDEKFARAVIDHLIKVYPPSSSLEERKWNWNIALAVNCLSQLRSLNRVAEAASRSLKAVCSLFDLYMKDFDLRRSMSLVDRRVTFLDEQILRPLEAISLTWPRPAALANWLRKLQPFESISLFGEMLGRFVGATGKGHDEIHQIMLEWAERGEYSHRVLALHALGIGWQDHPETLALLRRSAVNDSTPGVRSAAVRLLGKCFRDNPRILPSLRRIAVKDAHVSVRTAAVWTLVEYFRDDKDTLPLLRKIAIEDMGRDMHWSVRRMAVEALRQHFPGDAATFRLYRDLVVNHRKWSARSATVWALTILYRKNKQTPGLLRSRALEDKNADVRGAAVRALGEHFQDNSQTLPFLCMCAVKDNDGNVRRVAVRALGRHFKEAACALRAMRDRALNDPDVEVRNAAAWALS